MLCGDIHANPGPYNIVKTIQASFHQVDDKFGETKGTQCSCISLFGICFSRFTLAHRWNNQDLEHVIEQGDQLYKSLNCFSFLSGAELPKQVLVQHIPLDLLNFDTHVFGFLHCGSECINDLIFNLCQSVDHAGKIFFCEGYSISIITSSSKVIVVDDSHSHNVFGDPCPEGTAVILHFCDISDVAWYLIHLYLSISDKEHVQYEVQYVCLLTTLSFDQRHSVSTNSNSSKGFNIIKTVQASFHQSSTKFCELKGCQCSCIYMFVWNMFFII